VVQDNVVDVELALCVARVLGGEEDLAFAFRVGRAH
jgi:hypothetical protein